MKNLNIESLFLNFVFPVTVGFLKSIRDFSVSNKKIPIFVAREGYRLLPLYREYFGDAEYLYYSRRVASALNFSAQEYTPNAFAKSLKLHRFEGRLSDALSQRLPTGVLDEIRLLEADRPIDTRNVDDLNLLLGIVEANIELISYYAKQELVGFNASLGQMPSLDKWLLIDIGVFGTVQKSISFITKTEPAGFYLCGSEVNPLELKNYKYLLSYERSNYTKWSAWFECIFNAPYGTVIGFRSDGNPIFGRESRGTSNFNEMSRYFSKITSYIDGSVEAGASQLIEEAVSFISVRGPGVESVKDFDNIFFLENDFVRPGSGDKMIKVYI